MIQGFPGCVIISGRDGLAALAEECTRATASRRLSGYTVTDASRDLHKALRLAVARPETVDSGDVVPLLASPVLACPDAARLLECSERTVRRNALAYGGTRTPSGWSFDTQVIRDIRDSRAGR